MGYNILKELESDRDFKQLLAQASEEDQKELTAIKEGLDKRKAFMECQDLSRWYGFSKVSEKLEVIKEWYPRAYKTLERYVPMLLTYPDDMAGCILHLADSFIIHQMLPADQRMLTLCS